MRGAASGLCQTREWVVCTTVGTVVIVSSSKEFGDVGETGPKGEHGSHPAVRALVRLLLTTGIYHVYTLYMHEVHLV